MSFHRGFGDFVQVSVNMFDTKMVSVPQVVKNSITVPFLTFFSLCISFHLNALMPLGKSAFLMIYVSKARTKSHGKKKLN